MFGFGGGLPAGTGGAPTPRGAPKFPAAGDGGGVPGAAGGAPGPGGRAEGIPGRGGLGGWMPAPGGVGWIPAAGDAALAAAGWPGRGGVPGLPGVPVAADLSTARLRVILSPVADASVTRLGWMLFTV